MEPRFFELLGEIVVMGGLIEPLLLGGMPMNELNLSCDPEAAALLLSAPCPVTIVTGDLCLQVLLERSRYRGRAEESGSGVYRYLAPSVEPWFDLMETEYGIEGFYPWDVVAAVRLTEPSLFSGEREPLSLERRDTHGGFLSPSPGKGRPISLPRRIRRTEQLWNRVFESWERVQV